MKLSQRGGTGNPDAASFDNDFYLIIRILPVYLIHIPSVDRTDLLQGIDHAIHGRSPDFGIDPGCFVINFFTA